mmetsp:Transcript_20481/g.49855  ORF Transcript_20481/g.49855 Transcript_20481/m.49855 type:complete len:266 (-) Transcript_20481:242-1039(-)
MVVCSRGCWCVWRSIWLGVWPVPSGDLVVVALLIAKRCRCYFSAAVVGFSAQLAGTRLSEDVEQKVGRVEVRRADVPVLLEICVGVHGGPLVHHSAAGKQQQLVEEGEHLRPRLMDGADDRAATFCELHEKLEHVVGKRGVQTRRRLVEAQQCRVVQQLLIAMETRFFSPPDMPFFIGPPTAVPRHFCRPSSAMTFSTRSILSSGFLLFELEGRVEPQGLLDCEEFQQTVALHHVGHELLPILRVRLAVEVDGPLPLPARDPACY